MIAAFVLDTMPVNVAFQSTFHSDILSDIVAEQAELRSGVRFRIMDDPIRYKFKVISIVVSEILQPKVVSYLQGIPGAIFQ